MMKLAGTFAVVVLAMTTVWPLAARAETLRFLVYFEEWSARLSTDAQQAIALLENSLLAGEISKQTHDTISKQLEDPKISQRRLDDPSRPPNVAAIAGLILGSPEFQRR